MRRIEEYIADVIKTIKKKSAMSVAFDGVDTAGKTVLADKVETYMKKNGIFTPLRISIDKFHNPRQVRIKRGELSSEGYFLDSFNYEKIIENVLKPVRKNRGVIISGVYDYRTESEISRDSIPVNSDLVVLFDGIFLNRDEIRTYWDLSIFIDISFDTMLTRALQRDMNLFKSEEEIIRRYTHRYIPGEKIYLDTCSPKDKAHIVIDNNDYTHPKVIKSAAEMHNAV